MWPSWKTISAAMLWLYTAVSAAGLATDVKSAYEREAELRPIIDAYLKSESFDMSEFLTEIRAMPINAPVALVYMVEFDSTLANAAFSELIEDSQDIIVAAIVVAAKDESPAMCPMVKAVATESKAAATESIVAVSTEAPTQTGAAMQCAKSENVIVEGLVDEPVGIDLQFGGDSTQPPISPN